MPRQPHPKFVLLHRRILTTSFSPWGSGQTPAETLGTASTCKEDDHQWLLMPADFEPLIFATTADAIKASR